MKNPLVYVTGLVILASIVVATMAGQMYFARMKTEEQRDSLAGKLDRLEEERKSRDRALVKLLGMVPDETLGESLEDPLSSNYVKRYRTFVDGRCKKLNAPLPPNFHHVKGLVDELGRALEWSLRRADEYKLEKENMESRWEDSEDKCARLKEEHDRYLREMRPRDPIRDTNVRFFERQVTDLRERIKTLAEENERIGEEKRRREEELLARIQELELENLRERRTFHHVRPALMELIESPRADLKFMAARALDSAGRLDPEKLRELAILLGSPSKIHRREGFRFFADMRRHGPLLEASRNAFQDENLPTERRLEILDLHLANGLHFHRELAAALASTLKDEEKLEAAELFARHEAGYALSLLAGLAPSPNPALSKRALEKLSRHFPGLGKAPGFTPESWKSALLEYGDDRISDTNGWLKLREVTRNSPPPSSLTSFEHHPGREWFVENDLAFSIKVLDESLRKLAVLREPEGRSTEIVLAESAARGKARLAYRRGTYLVGSKEQIEAWDREHPPWNRAILAWGPSRFQVTLRLEDPKVDFDFMDTHIEKAAEYLGKSLDINVLVMGEAALGYRSDEMMVQLRANSITGWEFIDLTSMLKNLRYEIRWNTLLWGMQADLISLYDIPLLSPEGDLPRARAWNRNTFSFDYDAVSFRDVLQDIEKAGLARLTVGPDVSRRILEGKVRLELEEVTVAQFLHLLLVPRGLTLKAPDMGDLPVVVMKK